jgi:2-oxoglutarate dehydrogenase E2 component (dihydrolipoamide succinyltransferase)
MAIELVVPTVGESITEVEIGTWLKSPGDFVEEDEPIVEIESDKATVEVSAPAAGIVSEILKQTGEVANVGDLIGTMEPGEKPAGDKKAPAEDTSKAESDAKPEATPKPEDKEPEKAPASNEGGAAVMPAAQRALADSGLKADQVEGTGKGGRVLKEDVQRAAKGGSTPAAPAQHHTVGHREEEVVRMTPMRRTIAAQLVEAQQTAAMLTTFNEADMTDVIALRSEYKEKFEKKHGVRLGFMSFFVKAAVEALKAFPAVNAEIRGDDAVYKNYYDIGIAVSGKKGLVVPVLRNAERMSFADVESTINDYAHRAQSNKIKLEELHGGTFTITNGGIFGSMLSTPILNPPQSGILGMHNIQQRPVVRDGEIVARPMMYLALTYDHRIVDGREAVSFLVRIKECIENPSRILLEI